MASPLPITSQKSHGPCNKKQYSYATLSTHSTNRLHKRNVFCSTINCGHQTVDSLKISEHRSNNPTIEGLFFLPLVVTEYQPFHLFVLFSLCNLLISDICSKIIGNWDIQISKLLLVSFFQHQHKLNAVWVFFDWLLFTLSYSNKLHSHF